LTAGDFSVTDDRGLIRREELLEELDAGEVGPILRLHSNIAGAWSQSDSDEVHETFLGNGFHFRWAALPGPSDEPITGFSYALEDSSSWSPYSLDSTEYPEQIDGDPEETWIPLTTEDLTSVFVRAIDAAGSFSTVVAKIRIFPGPRHCPPSQRYILAVLDTDPTEIMNSGIFPFNYREVERELVHDLLEGYDFQIHATYGTAPPPLSVLNCASSTIWLHSSDVFYLSDRSVLQDYHRERPNDDESVHLNVLPAYIRSGGNLLLCGIRPVNALRYFEDDWDGPSFHVDLPIDFCSTLEDPELVPHWAATTLGVCSVENTIGQEFGQPVLALASSQITGGANPYPDLPFDPLSFPEGPMQGGFRYFDTGIEPASGAEVIYTDAATGNAIGIRKLTAPGLNGNTIYLGFHPYFIEKNAFRDFVHAALTDFGEVPVP
jgi:hypothetical protein